ncbi:MAG: hypothetical protein QNK85_02375 [Crocinitomicaceae bacterium]
MTSLKKSAQSDVLKLMSLHTREGRSVSIRFLKTAMVRQGILYDYIKLLIQLSIAFEI